jgi:hypothetical protein
MQHDATLQKISQYCQSHAIWQRIIPPLSNLAESPSLTGKYRPSAAVSCRHPHASFLRDEMGVAFMQFRLGPVGGVSGVSDLEDSIHYFRPYPLCSSSPINKRTRA